MTEPVRMFWQTPAVRHLAWLCQAPTLIESETGFAIDQALPADTTARLLALDEAPAPLLDRLNTGPHQRLGHYFENLYHFLLTDILGWSVLLRNLPVRHEQGRTLGELDFVVRNPVTDQLQHHEVAVKFYLGYPSGYTTRWYGPNAHDRLDLKTRRMLDHQCRMTERSETRKLLAEHHLDEPIVPALAMPGYLFYPSSTPPDVSTPDWVNPNHEHGRWLHWPNIADQDTSNWVPLLKPDWLGRYQSLTPPQPDITGAALAHVHQQGWPRMFAAMAARPEGDGFEEVGRWFVMPEQWPVTT